MTKFVSLLLSAVLMLTGCTLKNNKALFSIGGADGPTAIILKSDIDTISKVKVLKSYVRNTDGTWGVQQNTYKYRLEIGMNLPCTDSCLNFVFLSNYKDGSLTQALKASQQSSDMEDTLTKDLLLVEVGIKVME